MPNTVLRPLRDDDAAAVIDLIRNCWAEYPGVVFDLDGEIPELRALAAYFTRHGGAAWVAESDGTVTGMVGVTPEADDIWRIGKMYVARTERGSGVASELLNQAETYAIARGAKSFVLWSDSRFSRAHRFYEKHSYLRAGPIIPLTDKSHTIELVFTKPVDGVVVLNVAQAASAAAGLARILVACVDDGASVSFLPPLSPETALAFWRARATEVAQGKRAIIAAWAQGELAGCVSLSTDMPQNQSHRADVQKLLVAPGARRRGIARALMLALETEADRVGRYLLLLDTKEGDSAEGLYRSLGYIEVGRVPDFAEEADGKYCATVFYYRNLSQ